MRVTSLMAVVLVTSRFYRMPMIAKEWRENKVGMLEHNFHRAWFVGMREMLINASPHQSIIKRASYPHLKILILSGDANQSFRRDGQTLHLESRLLNLVNENSVSVESAAWRGTHARADATMVMGLRAMKTDLAPCTGMWGIRIFVTESKSVLFLRKALSVKYAIRSAASARCDVVNRR